MYKVYSGVPTSPPKASSCLVRLIDRFIFQSTPYNPLHSNCNTMKMSDQEENLHRTQTAESVFLPISREAFEKLYLSPKNPRVSGDLRKKLGNPTPISLLGFLIASTSNACIMMGWRGAGGQGAAIV